MLFRNGEIKSRGNVTDEKHEREEKHRREQGGIDERRASDGTISTRNTRGVKKFPPDGFCPPIMKKRKLRFYQN